MSISGMNTDNFNRIIGEFDAALQMAKSQASETKQCPESTKKSDKFRLFEAAVSGNITELQILVSEKVDPNIADQKGRTAAHFAAWHGRKDFLEKLAANGADLSAADKERRTPAHLAASTGKLDSLRLLFDKGAKLDARDNKGLTPEDVATMRNHLECVQFLVSHTVHRATSSSDSSEINSVDTLSSERNFQITRFEKTVTILCRDKEDLQRVTDLISDIYENFHTEKNTLQVVTCTTATAENLESTLSRCLAGPSIKR